MADEPFRHRLLLAWHAYERQLWRRVDATEFARALGVSRPTLADWAKAENPPPYERVTRIAAVTGLNREWLIYGGTTEGSAPAEPPLLPATSRRDVNRKSDGGHG